MASTLSLNNVNIGKAKKRWILLAKALIQKEKSIQELQMVSVRRVDHFGLLTIKPLIEQSGENWYEYTVKVETNLFCIKICHVNINLTASQLMGFNNTGNICVWPSEEVLAYYCLYKSYLFNNKRVLELGGGMTCLAGILIAKYLTPNMVHVTDGNVTSMANVKKIIDINKLNVHSSILKWGSCSNSDDSSHTLYDVVLAADCLFFDETRRDFVETLNNFLSDSGIALIAAPRRGKTLDSFVECAEKSGFCTLVLISYNDVVWTQHSSLKLTNPYYDEDIHYPLLVVVTKCATSLLPFQS